ncbi:rhodanese-like domain-containing protein [Peptoniphilus sp.]|uniref:rhodanese-like domain-containing protein n=1 Tax=Peptoniphilus sp. TaxID=1971214 RepID=UPI003991269A
MKNIKLFSVVALALALLVGCSNDKPANQGANKTNAGTATDTQVAYSEMTGEELDKIQEDNKEKENYLVIDVRPAEQYNEGHVKHAINIPVDELKDRLAEIESYKDKDVVTVCNTGKKSSEAAQILVDNGFTKVANAQGVKDFEYTTMTKAATVLGPKFNEMAKSGNYTIIDVRDEKDYNEGHIEGALHTTADTYMDDIKSFPTDKPFLTYCYSGNRSWAVADELAKEGHEVYNAYDGTKEYDGYELVK